MTILLFGITRDIIGSPSLSLSNLNTTEIQLPKTVKELREFLESAYPELNKLSSLAIAVNNSYADDNAKINIYDEIALIPPVSGG